MRRDNTLLYAGLAILATTVLSARLAKKGFTSFVDFVNNKIEEVLELGKQAAKDFRDEAKRIIDNMTEFGGFSNIPTMFDIIEESLENEKDLDIVFHVFKDELKMFARGKLVSILPLVTNEVELEEDQEDLKTWDNIIYRRGFIDPGHPLKRANLPHQVWLQWLPTILSEDGTRIAILANFVKLARLYFSVKFGYVNKDSNFRTKLMVTEGQLPVNVEIKCFEMNLPALFSLVNYFHPFASTLVQNCSHDVLDLGGLLLAQSVEAAQGIYKPV